MGARPRTSATGTRGSSRSAAARGGSAGRRPPRARPPRSSPPPLAVPRPPRAHLPHLPCSARHGSAASPACSKRRRARLITQARRACPRSRSCPVACVAQTETASPARARVYGGGAATCGRSALATSRGTRSSQASVATAHRFSRVLSASSASSHTPGFDRPRTVRIHWRPTSRPKLRARIRVPGVACLPCRYSRAGPIRIRHPTRCGLAQMVLECG